MSLRWGLQPIFNTQLRKRVLEIVFNYVDTTVDFLPFNEQYCMNQKW